MKHVRLKVGLMTTHYFSSRVKYAFLLCVGLFLFLTFSSGVLAVNNLLFDAASKTVKMGDTLEVPINIHGDSGVNIIGADVWMTFDEAYLDVQSLNQGEYFPSVTGQKTNTGQMYVAGMLEDTTTTKSGDGTIATVLFTPQKTGTTQIVFDCRGNSVSDTSKINVNFSNPQNVIDCASTVSNKVTIVVASADSGDGSSTTPTPTITGSSGSPDDGSAPYVPGDTTISPTPSTLPQSGFFDNSLYYLISGGFLMGVGGILQKLNNRPF